MKKCVAILLVLSILCIYPIQGAEILNCEKN